MQYNHKVGDKVIILRDEVEALMGRRKPWKGTVKNIDGESIEVVPSWCTKSIIFNQSEVTSVPSKKTTSR